MKRMTIIIIAVLVIIILLGFIINNKFGSDARLTENQASENTADEVLKTGTPIPDTQVSVIPISHATMALQFGDITVYTDPVGGKEAFDGVAAPDLILLTDIHGDHLDLGTLEALVGDETVIIAPGAVVAELSPELVSKTVTMSNGGVVDRKSITIKAMPMYNLPESEDSGHVKGRGNGYLLEFGGKRIYIAGDTADIPEMRALQNIDAAFIPMNPPYTMTVESAADAVIEFKPRNVYPYHYRTPDGLSDVEQFKQIVDTAQVDVNVVLLNWYQ